VSAAAAIGSKAARRQPVGPVPLILIARVIRGVADGMMVVGLPIYFTTIGLNLSQVGVVTTAFQIGTVAALVWAGRLSRDRGPGLSLMLCSGLMLISALGFMATRDFGWVIFFALLGAINPMAIDATVFRPLEQGALLETSAPSRHPGLIAAHGFIGQLAGALGSLVVSAPAVLRSWYGIEVPETIVFALAALCAFPMFAIYWRLTRVASAPAANAAPPPLKVPPSNRLRLLLGLFSLDALAGGLVSNTLLLVWMHQRFAMPDAVLGVLFFGIAIGTAAAQFLSIPLVRRVGLVWGIILPNATSSALLIPLALAPSYDVALALFFLRSVLGVLDVPARSAFVVAHDAPRRFAFSLSVTNVVMAIANALGALLAAWVFTISLFAWPLIVAAGLRFAYSSALYFLHARGRL
jgi:MFS family permease